MIEDFRIEGVQMRENAHRFAHQDTVEQGWRVVTPALQAHSPVCPYAPGGWGPAEADQILGGGRWHHPSPGKPV